VPYSRLSPPALGDLDHDEDLEIVVGGWDYVYAYHHDGNSVQNWPVSVVTGGNINSSPVIADIDGDTNQVEILVKVSNNFYAFHADGSLVTGYPYFLDDQSHTGTTTPSPAVTDADSDGDLELVFGSNYGEVHFFDELDSFNFSFAYWPMHKQNCRNTGFYQGPVSPEWPPHHCVPIQW
jgi:hypothetical protein